MINITIYVYFPNINIKKRLRIYQFKEYKMKKVGDRDRVGVGKW